jgi:hypothetical protein
MHALMCCCTQIEKSTGWCGGGEGGGVADWCRICSVLCFCFVLGCASAQVHNEMKELKREGVRVSGGGAGPPLVEMSMPDESTKKSSPSRESGHGGEPSSSTY